MLWKKVSVVCDRTTCCDVNLLQWKNLLQLYFCILLITDKNYQCATLWRKFWESIDSHNLLINFVLYHALSKIDREKHLCAESLGVRVLKISRDLSIRWSASSLRSLSAVWHSYKFLVRHFGEVTNDSIRDENDMCTYNGLNIYSLFMDFALIYDALQELLELSLDLCVRSQCEPSHFKSKNKCTYLVF